MTIIAQVSRHVSPPLLAMLREDKDVSVAACGEALWIRADDPAAKCLARIKILPRLGLFELISSDKLAPLGCRLPVEALPEGLTWHALSYWLVPEPPATNLPAAMADDAQIQLKVVRGGSDGKLANLLLTTMGALHAYAEHAPLSRLTSMRFAASGDGRMAVFGEPLLPLPGRYYHCAEGVALPLACHLEPDLSGAALAELLSLAPSEIALFHDDGSFERLRQDDFLQMTRSAVRLTCERFTMSEDHPVMPRS